MSNRHAESNFIYDYIKWFFGENYMEPSLQKINARRLKHDGNGTTLVCDRVRKHEKRKRKSKRMRKKTEVDFSISPITSLMQCR